MFLTIEVVDGQGQRRLTETSEQSAARQFVETVTVIDGSVTEEVTKDMRAKLQDIYAFTEECVSEYYLCSIDHMSLAFGIDDPVDIVLLGNATCETASFSTRYTPEEQSQRKERTSPEDLMRSINERVGLEIEHLNKDGAVYCTETAKDCGHTMYRVPASIVLLFRIDREFKEIEQRELMKVVKQNLVNKRAKVPCCMFCYHRYMAMYRVFRCSKKPVPLQFGLPPAPFQSIVLSEANTIGKKPLSSTCRPEPHSFMLNIVDSPYQNVTLPVRELPKPVPRPRDPCGKSTPTWVKRLTGEVNPATYMHSQAGTRATTAVAKSKTLAGPVHRNLNIYEPSRPVSQQLARRSYMRDPFNISLLDPKRKKALQKRRVD